MADRPSNEDIIAELEAAAAKWVLEKNKYTLGCLRAARADVLKRMQPVETTAVQAAEIIRLNELVADHEEVQRDLREILAEFSSEDVRVMARRAIERLRAAEKTTESDVPPSSNPNVDLAWKTFLTNSAVDRSNWEAFVAGWHAGAASSPRETPPPRIRSHRRRQPFHSTHCVCVDCEKDNAAEQVKTGA